MKKPDTLLILYFLSIIALVTIQKIIQFSTSFPFFIFTGIFGSLISLSIIPLNEADKKMYLMKMGIIAAIFIVIAFLIRTFWK